MKKVMILMLVGLVGMFLTGCASIMHGTKQNVKIDSNPAGAAYKIINSDGEVVEKGFAPSNVKLSRKKSYEVVMVSKGYNEAKISLDKKFSAMYLGNILIGGPLGLIIDASNGAMYKLSTDSVYYDFITNEIK